jgi:hypothetical protein
MPPILLATDAVLIDGSSTSLAKQVEAGSRVSEPVAAPPSVSHKEALFKRYRSRARWDAANDVLLLRVEPEIEEIEHEEDQRAGVARIRCRLNQAE